MMQALKVVAVLVGAAATAVLVIFATTFGDCSPQVTLAACEQGKADALRTGMPIGMLLYAAFAAAVWRWPRILRWPRP